MVFTQNNTKQIYNRFLNDLDRLAVTENDESEWRDQKKTITEKLFDFNMHINLK